MIYTFNNLTQAQAVKKIAENHAPQEGEFAFVYEEEKQQLNDLSDLIEQKDWASAYLKINNLSIAVREKIPSHILVLVESHYYASQQEVEARLISERAHIELDLTKQQLGEDYKNAKGPEPVEQVVEIIETPAETIIEGPAVETIITDAGIADPAEPVILEQFKKKKKKKKSLTGE